MYHDHITPLSDLPAQLRRLRKAHGMKLRDVDLKTGISVSFLSDVERGRTEPSLTTLRKLAACYGARIVVEIDGLRGEHIGLALTSEVTG